MTLLIDSGAGSNLLPSIPPLDTLASLCDLSLGSESNTRSRADVCIFGNGPDGETVRIGVEVKTPGDFTSSRSSGRLAGTQIPAMIEAGYHATYLLIYGGFRCGPNGELEIEIHKTNDKTSKPYSFWITKKWGNQPTSKPVQWSYIQHQLLDLSRCGVQYDKVSDIYQAAHWIADLHTYWTKPYEEHGKSMKVFDTSGKSFSLMPTKLAPKIKICAEVASRFPGLRYERAVAVAKHFGGSVRRMVNAGVDEWSEIVTESAKGRKVRIGRVIAETIEREVFE